MPFKSEHAARIKSPTGYTSFTRKQLTDGVTAIIGIKDGKSEIQSIRFDSNIFTPEQAQAWLSKNGFKPIEFAKASGGDKNLEELIVPQYVDQKLEYIRDTTTLSDEELNGNAQYPKGFRKIKLVALRPGTFNGVPYPEEVLREGAESWINQPNKRQGYFKMNHGNDVLKRAGPIEKSYWDENHKAIIHEGKITVPEYIERWDAGVLDTTSVEMGVGFNLADSKPGNLVAKLISGRDNAFVERPACKTCGTQELALLEHYLEDRDLNILSEEELRKKGIILEDIDLEDLCKNGTAEADALYKLFENIYGRYFDNLEDTQIPEELEGKGSFELLKKLRDGNLDKDGKCKLDSSDDMGHCLTVPNVKRLTASALGLGNSNYMRPIMYEGYRQGIINDSTLKKAGYDPENIQKNEDDVMNGRETPKSEEEKLDMLLNYFGIDPTMNGVNSNNQNGGNSMSEELLAKLKKDLEQDPVQITLSWQEVQDLIKFSETCDEAKTLLEQAEIIEKESATTNVNNAQSELSPDEIQTLKDECSAGKVASCAKLKDAGVEMEAEPTQGGDDGMVSVSKTDLEEIKSGLSTVVTQNKELKEDNKTLLERVKTLEEHNKETEKQLMEQKLAQTKAEIIKSAKALGITVKPESLELPEGMSVETHLASLEARKAGYDAVMHEIPEGIRPHIEAMDLEDKRTDTEKQEDKELEDLETKMFNLYQGDEVGE